MQWVQAIALTIAVLLSYGTPAPAAAPEQIAAVRMRFTSSASPAVGDVNGDGRPDIAVTSDNIGDKTRSLNDPYNVNAVSVLCWSNGRLQPLTGWPRPTRDATLGLSMGDLDGDRKDEVVASCAQDTVPLLMEKAGHWLVSRLYVWRGSGKPLASWYPSEKAGLRGMAFGHAYAAPLLVDINGDGRLDVLQASQGVWRGTGFAQGGFRLWSGGGDPLGSSQSQTATLPWHTYPSIALDTTPVLADLDGDGYTEIVAASFDGRLYAWDRKGTAVPGWMPSTGAKTQTEGRQPIRGGIAAVDFDGDGRDEIAAGGLDGAVYLWDGRGKLLWRRVPDTGPAPAVSSGIAVGRLDRTKPKSWHIVCGDAAGNVTAWNRDGTVLWRNRISPGYSVEAEPAIGDVNADGNQDVVVGGTDGYVHAWDGPTGRLLWQVHTWWAPTPDGMRLEAVFGAPALVDLRGNGRLCVVVATGQRYADIPARRWYGFGHLLVYDCGPTRGTPDWPQYRRNARRTGRAVSQAEKMEGTRAMSHRAGP